MKTYSHSGGRKAFTLIELLVVIAIIAMLLAIVVPALGKAKIIAQKVICSNNIKSQALGVRLYSEQNKGRVPLNQGGNWFWDMSFWATNQITQYSGVDYKSFYCPVMRNKKSEDARYWQFSWCLNGWGLSNAQLQQPQSIRDESTLTAAQQQSNYRVLSYIYTIDRRNATGSMYPDRLYGTGGAGTGPKANWVSNMANLPNASGHVLIADSTLSASYGTYGDNFTEVVGGMYTTCGVYDSTNHVTKSAVKYNGRSQFIPVDTNVVYADGHVQRKDFKEIEVPKIQLGQWFYW